MNGLFLVFLSPLMMNPVDSQMKPHEGVESTMAVISERMSEQRVRDREADAAKAASSRSEVVAANDTEEALAKTSAMLKDPVARERAAKENSAAASAHAEVQKLGGAETQDAVYRLSAEVMQGMVQQTGGDPVKLQELVARAQKDPEAFARGLSPDIQARVRSIASEVPGNDPGNAVRP